MRNTNKGFTLIEILVIIGILIILTGITVPAFRYSQKESHLSSSVEEIINILRLVQNKTLASEEASQWGAYFDTTTTPHQYVSFKGMNYLSRDIAFDEIYRLPKVVEIYEINLGGENEVVFDRISGETSHSGNIKIRLINNLSKTETIYIESSGQIGLTSPPTPSDENRIKDSRHVHFDLGWSIQDAVALKFYFPDIPQIETINMTNYFNIDETEFDWEGMFSVGEINQVFQIHTHSLDAFNALLCIHRDRNQEKNNQEVIIYIVDNGIDKEIARYYNGEVEVDSYGGIMEIQ